MLSHLKIILLSVLRYLYSGVLFSLFKKRIAELVCYVKYKYISLSAFLLSKHAFRYLYSGIPFGYLCPTLVPDHHILCWWSVILLMAAKPAGRPASWNRQVVYRRRLKHSNADPLSRSPLPSVSVCGTICAQTISSFCMDSVGTAQHRDLLITSLSLWRLSRLSL